MKILLVNTYYYPEVLGGAEYSVKKLAHALTQKGHTVLVMAAAKECAYEKVDEIYVKRIRFHSMYHSYGDVKKSFLRKVTRRLLDFINPFNRKLINEVFNVFKPDIIHTNNLYEITPEVWRVAKKHNVPVVHTIRDYYLMCPKCTLLTRKETMCVKPNMLCKIYQNINRNICKNVDILTAPSKMMITEVENKKYFNHSNKQVIYNASEFDLVQIEENIRKRNYEILGEIKFIYLGSLLRHKGIKFLLDAFHGLESPKVQLIIAGKGPEKELVEQACKSDDRISYVGFLEQNELDLLLGTCDILVCPSLWNEPFGRVVLDAYINGLPVIASNVGAMPEIVDNEKTGLLVEPSNIEELIRAMNRFILDKQLIVKFRNNLASKLSCFTIDRQANDFEDIYKRLLEKNE